MTYPIPQDETERLAKYQLAAHRTPAVIRTAGDITKCACSACLMASYITTAAEVVRAARMYSAGYRNELWKALRAHDAVHGPLCEHDWRPQASPTAAHAWKCSKCSATKAAHDTGRE